MGDKAGLIFRYFSDLPEPRYKNKRHNLLDIVIIAICAVICGCDTWEDIEEFGRTKYEWLKRFLELPSGIPSHDTFRRLFARINPVEFQKRFIEWIRAVNVKTEGQIISIDGKTVRRSFDKSTKKAAIHMVSAWASKNSVVLGQIKTKNKSNEIKAIPELLDLLELEGCIITIDAMGCQRDIASKIIDKRADYLLSLKKNQGNLHENVRLFFEDVRQNKFKDVEFDYYETVDGDHGRIETRRYWTVSDIDWLQGKELWRDLKTIVMVERQRDMQDKVTKEISYYISSMDNSAKEIGKAVRRHWGIENSVHWILDISFREDECRIRKDNGPENFTVLRHIALNLLRKAKTEKRRSIKTKRLKAGWDNDFLIQVLNSF